MVNGVRWALLSIVTAVSGALFGLLLDRVAFPANYQLVFIISFLAGAATLWTFSRLRLATGASPVASTRVSLGLLNVLRLVRRAGLCPVCGGRVRLSAGTPSADRRLRSSVTELAAPTR
jgi:hypothetical protein